jgi:hypothetical protein
MVLSKEGKYLDASKFPLCEALGALMYLAVCIRTDISYAVGDLTRYMSAPMLEHWAAVKVILWYVK